MGILKSGSYFDNSDIVKSGCFIVTVVNVDDGNVVTFLARIELDQVQLSDNHPQ